MELSEADILLIEKYWRDELDADAKSQVNARMEREVDYANTVQDLQFIFSGIEGHNELELEKKLIVWSKEAEPVLQKTPSFAKNNLESKTKEFKLWKWLSSAAALALITLAAVFLLPKTQTSQEVYVEVFEPYPDLISQRGNVEVSQLKEALDLYTAGKYTEAISLLQAENERAENDERVGIYLGISCSQIRDHACAQASFDQVISTTLGNTRYTALWHKSLDHLKNGKLENASNVLKQISADPQNPFGNQAKELLENQIFTQ